MILDSNCPYCHHPWSAHNEKGCTIQTTDNFGPTKSCDCETYPTSEVAELSEEDVERIARIGRYVDLLSDFASPLMEEAAKADDPAQELASLSIALLTVAHISLHPFSPEERADLDEAAAELFDQFHDQVMGSLH